MQMRKKTFDDTTQWLWTDLPTAQSQARTRSLQSDPATIDEWIDNGYAILPQAVALDAAAGFVPICSPGCPLPITI